MLPVNGLADNCEPTSVSECSVAGAGRWTPPWSDFLLHKARAAPIWVNGIPLLGSLWFACQPHLHLFSPHLQLTLRVFRHPPLLIPLGGKSWAPPASSQQPLGHGTIKKRGRSSVKLSRRASDGPVTVSQRREQRIWHRSPKKIIYCVCCTWDQHSL